MKRLNKKLIAIMISLALIGQNLIGMSFSYASTDFPASINVAKIADQTNVTVGDEIILNYTYSPSPILRQNVEHEDYNKVKDVVIVMDTSGSMKWNLEGETEAASDDDNFESRLSIAKTAALDFITGLKNQPNVRVSLIVYNYRSSVYFNGNTPFYDLSNQSQFTALYNSINGLQANGGTNIGDGIRRAYYTLSNYGISGAKQYIAVLTDGEPTAFSTTELSYNATYTSSGMGGYYSPSGYFYDDYLQSNMDYVTSINSVTYKTNSGKADNFYVNWTASGDYNNYSYNYALLCAGLLDNIEETSYFIAFSSDANANKLASIATRGNAIYTQALDAGALDDTYDDIAIDIVSDITIHDLYFEETFSEEMEIISYSEELEQEGQVVKGNLGNVGYQLNSAGTYYVADPINLSITIKPKVIGNYTLGDNNSSYVYYKDIDDVYRHKYFNEINITANSSLSEPKNILEVTQTGQSELAPYYAGTDTTITTVSMKSFVALRDDLDGVYDLIYIGSGDYNPVDILQFSNGGISKQNRAIAHDTNSIMNDITNLKANEIINEFIEKGQLVVLHNDIYEYDGSVLETKFDLYRYNDFNNVKVVQTVNEAATEINRFSYEARPYINLLNAPVSYHENQGYAYAKNDTISYQYEIVNQQDISTNLTAKLYIDRDFDKMFEANELLVTESADGTLNYNLPKGYSAPYYWKLEVIDNTTGLKDVFTNVFLFKDVKPEIKVLQVRKGLGGAGLNNSNQFTTAYLQDDYYDIQIDVTDAAGFNSTEGDYSYTKINGNYDMIVFGFADSYGDNSITDSAMSSLKSFVNTGQGVMMTHDMLINSGTSPKFINEMIDLAGQKVDSHHLLGHGAPETTTETAKVNEGILTQFPFALDNNIKINLTHNQYYGLDLEDEEVVTWYNLRGGFEKSRDITDSYNHYYTYNKGNITYSGTGHTNSNFPDEEQKLFVNTMYRAFFGSNHNPDITVIKPEETDIVDASNEVNVDFIIDDLDLSDTISKVKVYVEDELVYAKDNYINGTEHSDIYDEDDFTIGADGTKDTVTVKIEAEDARGAKTVEEIEIPVDRGNAISQITRVFPVDVDYYADDDEYIALINDEHEITYYLEGDNLNIRNELPKEIVLILNISGTMASYINNQGTGQLQEAAKSFIASLPKDKDINVAAVTYAPDAKVLSELVDISNSANVNSLYNSINSLTTGYGTNLGEGLRVATQLLDNGKVADKVFVILTDGFDNTGVVKRQAVYNNIEDLVYNVDFDEGINDDIVNKDTGEYTRIGVAGVTQLEDGTWLEWTTNPADGQIYKHTIGQKYVKTIADEIVKKGLNINSHLIHFTRIDNDVKARELNNGTARALGVTKEVNPGEYFIVAEDANQLVDAFNEAANKINNSIQLNDVAYIETFPEGVKVIEYPAGMSYDEGTNTLSGTINNLTVEEQADGTYKTTGEFTLKLKYKSSGNKVLNQGKVIYTEPYDDTEVTEVEIDADTVKVLPNNPPTITVNNPSTSDIVNATNELNLDFIVEDIDWFDDKTEVTVWIEGNEVEHIEEYVNGSNFVKLYDADNGDFTIDDDDFIHVKIEAKDLRDGITEWEMYVPYVRGNIIKEIERSLWKVDQNTGAVIEEIADTDKYFAGDKFVIRYEFIGPDDDMALDSVTFDNVSFTEYLPRYVKVESGDLPVGFSYTMGADGYVISGDIKDYVTLVQDPVTGKYNIPAGTVFEITVYVDRLFYDTYVFDHTDITYTDPNGNSYMSDTLDPSHPDYNKVPVEDKSLEIDIDPKDLNDLT